MTTHTNARSKPKNKTIKPDQSKFINSKDLKDVVYVYGGDGPTAGYGLYIEGYWVMKRTFETMWQKAIAFVPNMQPGYWFYTKNLWQPAEWTLFEDGEKHNLGRSLKFFADQGMLPLRVLNPRGTGPKKFERI